MNPVARTSANATFQGHWCFTSSFVEKENEKERTCRLQQKKKSASELLNEGKGRRKGNKSLLLALRSAGRVAKHEDTLQAIGLPSVSQLSDPERLEILWPVGGTGPTGQVGRSTPSTSFTMIDISSDQTWEDSLCSWDSGS